MDVLTPEQRRLNMSRIKGGDTKPELMLRSALHRRGLRFRVRRRDLPGCPDIVFARWRTLVFMHGCFWHVHGCQYTKMPATRREFWKTKLAGNRQRDQRNMQALIKAGWRVVVVWECAMRGRKGMSPSLIAEQIERFMRQKGSSYLELSGQRQGESLRRFA